jgi:CubicO group peptidase (beta-lactamase class C family)
MNKTYSLFIALILGFPACLPAQVKQDQDYASLVRSEYPDNEPGAAVLIAKISKPLYTEALGMASLALGVAMRPEMVFEIGSMTKQFILMLLEEGKLSLTDEITRSLPD